MDHLFAQAKLGACARLAVGHSHIVQERAVRHYRSGRVAVLVRRPFAAVSDATRTASLCRDESCLYIVHVLRVSLG